MFTTVEIKVYYTIKEGSLRQTWKVNLMILTSIIPGFRQTYTDYVERTPHYRYAESLARYKWKHNEERRRTSFFIGQLS